MPDDTIYMTPRDMTNDTIWMSPLSENDRVIYMYPKDSEETGWELIGTYTWNSSNATSWWTNTPGHFGSDVITLSGKTSARIVGVSGHYDDDTAVHGYIACLGFVSSIDSNACGVGQPLEPSPVVDYSLSSAEATWASSSCTLDIGVDGKLGWGFQDVITGNNEGSLTFEVWAI